MWEFILQHVIICSESEKSVSHSFFSHPILLRPHGLQPTRLLWPWNSPGKNTWVGCHFLLQGIFPTQESSPSLLHCRQILHHVSHKRNWWFEVGGAQFILWHNVWSSINFCLFFFFCLSPYTFNYFTFQFTSESLQCCPLLSPFTELILALCITYSYLYKVFALSSFFFHYVHFPLNTWTHWEQW